MTKFNQNWQPKFSFKGNIPLELMGDRLVLRAPSIRNYPEWAALRKKNQIFLTPYEPEWLPQCLNKNFFLQRLNLQKDERAAGRGEFFLIHDCSNQKIIGGINLNNIQFGAACHASLGYWLGEQYQGAGYMREAALLVIDYAFNVLNLRRINAACLPSNTRSIKLLNGLGFEEEGVAKKYLQINGHWQDHKLFGLLNPNQLNSS